MDPIPDDGLITAAKADGLSNDDGIRRETDRLLGTDRVKQSLSQTMLAWLQTARLAQVTKDAKYADFGALQASMFTETSMFVDNFLWGQPGSLGDLLTSTRTFVDPGLAKFYGVTYPGAANSKTFMPVDLPKDQRAGVLTQASMLSIKAGPDNTSVIFRGLFVHDMVLCLPEISPPQDAATQMKITEQEMGVQSEVQKAQYRKETSPCKGCHANFDPFGLTLEAYDGIGKYRTKDETGVAIDPSVDFERLQELRNRWQGLGNCQARGKDQRQWKLCNLPHESHHDLRRQPGSAGRRLRRSGCWSIAHVGHRQVHRHGSRHRALFHVPNAQHQRSKAMISYSLARRNFMWGVGAATGLHALLRGAEAAAQGAKPPKRFMVIHHPVGGNHDNWKVTGTEYDFTLSMILDPFKDVRANMVVISGMNIIKKAKPGTAGSGCHEGNTVCLMNGEPHDGLWPGNGGDDAKVGAASVDQLFLNKAPTTLGAAAGKIASLQVACDERTDARRVFYTPVVGLGPGVPMDRISRRPSSTIGCSAISCPTPAPGRWQTSPRRARRRRACSISP